MTAEGRLGDTRDAGRPTISIAAMIVALRGENDARATSIGPQKAMKGITTTTNGHDGVVKM
jgi:hypothetical protein